MRSLGFLGFLLIGATACGPSGPAVPFGLDETEPAPSDGPEETTTTAEPGAGRTFVAGTTRVDVEGAPLEEAGSIRALLAQDLDGDGDRDVVALVGGPARVVFWRRDGSEFAVAQVLGEAPTPEGCEIAEAEVSPLGEAWLVARANIVCPDAPRSARVDHWVLDTDRTPRTLEHFAALGSDEPGARPLTIALASDDRDEDGRADLTVTLRLGDAEAPSIVLSWLDRPSGLARDGAEPEATFVDRSRDALRRLRRAPEVALARSQRVLAWHRVICRESGRARLLVGSSAGLSCGQSDGAGRAATTVVRAHAAAGRTLLALDALEAMEEPGLRINEERRSFSRRALADAPATPGVTLREGPTLATTTAGGPSVRLAALGFLDEDHVLLRGTRPMVWNIETGETQEPVEPVETGDRAVRDASGRFQVVGIERTCDGQVLRITSNGMPSASPLLAPRDPPAGVDCPLTGPLARETGGWRVLGWAPQGILAARGSELRVVPLDTSGRSAGAPRSLQPGTAPPAPLPPGAISADGSHMVQLHGPGVLLHRSLGSRDPELLWPEGWGELEGDPIDAAPSPSGRRVAVLRAGRVYLLERSEPTANP